MRRVILPFLGIAGIAFLALASCAARPAGGLRAIGLRCEYRHDPLGIDTDRPRLSWGLESTGRGRRQSAYRLMVASSLDALQGDSGDLWDTGRIDSDRTINIEYDGHSLTSGQRCYWKIMAWDEAGEPSPWSAPAWWETALLDGDDWTGVWIGDGSAFPTSSGTNPMITIHITNMITKSKTGTVRMLPNR